MSSRALALDPGFGSTKVWVAGKANCLQTAVAVPKDIGMAAIGMMSASGDTHIVRMENGREYAVGPGSWNRGEPISSMDYSAIVSPERTAMFYAALYEILDTKVSFETSALVIGLPVPLLRDAQQSRMVIDSLKSYKKDHTFHVDGDECVIRIDRVGYVAQPVGAYIDWAIREDGTTNQEANGAEVAIVDLGMNTLDIYTIIDAQVVETYVGGSEMGVKRLLENSQDTGFDISELDSRLRKGQLEIPKEQISTWIVEVLGQIKRVLPNLHRFSTIIPVGGGMVVAGDAICDALMQRGANIHITEDPVTANVRGIGKFCKKKFC